MDKPFRFTIGQEVTVYKGCHGKRGTIERRFVHSETGMHLYTVLYESGFCDYAVWDGHIETDNQLMMVD